MRVAGRAPSWAGAALVAVLVALPFLPVLRNDFVLWDDDLNLVRNEAYRGLGGAQLRWMFTTFHLGHYQPLSWMTLGLDWLVWGMNPAGYHLTSLVLHVANAVVLFQLLATLLARARPDLGPRAWEAGALVGALFFGLHPLRVESVAWASARRDVLSALFYLLTLRAYLAAAGATGARRARWLGAALACYALSLLSKGWAMTLPAVLLVLDVYPLRQPQARGWRAVLLEKVPFVALGVGAALLAAHGASVEAMRSFAQHGFLARAAQGAYGLCFYVAKTLVPLGLSPLYLLELPLDPSRPRYVAAGVVALAVTVALVLLRRRAPWALAAWVAYAATVAPVLGFAQSGPQIAADRYAYLACLPWATLVAAGAAAVPRARLAAPVVLAILAVLTVRQTAVWHDSRALWDRVLALDETNYVAYTNRGLVRQEAGDLAGARHDFDAALYWNPGHELAWNDRGIVRFTQGDVDGAIRDYTEAIRFRPRYAEAYLNRAIAREARGDVAGGIADYGVALQLDPGQARAWYGRANLRQARGDYSGAIADYDEAVRRAPRYVEAYANRAVARGAQGDVAGAIADYRRALAVAPGDFAARGRLEQALQALGARP